MNRNQRIEKTEYTVRTDKTSDKRIIFFSDVHGYPNEPITDMIKEIAPDIIMIGGDLVHDNSNYLSGIELLNGLVKIAPVYMSVGNHEKRCDPDIKERIRSTGTVLLDNDYIESEGLVTGGLSTGFPCGYRGRKTPPPQAEWIEAFVKKDGFKILLNHHPEYYDAYLKGLDVDLILSGHAHGGQWRFFGQGVYSPGQGIFPKYTHGMIDNRMIVTRGLGNPHMIPRINNKPEICVINIVKEIHG